MFRQKIRQMLLAAAVLILCASLFACSGDAGEDVNCVIGITSEGDAYTASIELADSRWEELTQAQKENVADQCISTVEFSKEDEDADYALTGVDKATGKWLFRYDSRSQKTVFERGEK